MRPSLVTTGLFMTVVSGVLCAQSPDSLPSATQRFDNPAVAVATPRANSPTLRLPLGLLGLFHPERNPFLYLKNEARFRRSFDAVSALSQLARPYEYVVNAPQSPDRVVLSIDAEGATLVDGEGQPLLTDLATQRSNPIYSLYRTPPLLRLNLRQSFLQFSSSFHIGGESVRARTNGELEDLLAGRSVASDSELALMIDAAAGAGLEQSVTAYTIFPGRRRLTGVVLAGRLALHYTAALADVGGSVTVGAANGTSETAFQGRLLYPGNGYSLGGRVDIGALLRAGGWYWGIGGASLASVDLLHGGTRLSDEPRREIRGGPGLVPSLQVGFDRGGPVAFHGEAGLYTDPGARATALFRTGALELHYSYRFTAPEEASFSVHAPLGAGKIIAALSAQQTALTNNALYSVRLSWELRASRELWRPEFQPGGRE